MKYVLSSFVMKVGVTYNMVHSDLAAVARSKVGSCIWLMES